MDSRARSKGDERVRFDRIAARFRRERTDDDLDECWVAFRRSTNERDPRRRGDRVVLDLERRNGAMLVGRRQALVVDGRVAVSAPGSGSEFRRIWAMIEEGHPTWTTDPLRIEEDLLGGRPVETLRWEGPEGSAVISYDVRTGMCVASTTPAETIELTDLRFDSDVPDEWFEEPPRLDGWTGGTALVMHDMDAKDLYSASWQPRSGPGQIYVDGPRRVPLDAALEWAQARAAHVTLGDEHGDQRDL